MTMTNMSSVSSAKNDDLQPGNALRSAIVLLLAAGFNLISSIRQLIQIGTWQAGVETGVIVLFVVSILISIISIRRRQVNRGVGLLLVSFIITITLRNALTTNMGILYGLIVFAITSAVAFYTFAPSRALRIASIGLVVGILLVLFDLYAPPYRQAATITSISYVAMAVIAIFTVLMGWKIWQLRHTLFRWSLTSKLLIPILGFFALVVGGLIFYNFSQTAETERVREAEDEARYNQVITDRLQSLETLALAISTDAANNREAVDAFVARDRDRLIEVALPLYQTASEQFGVAQFQFIEPPATSFLRLHQLENYGDDLTSFRFTVVVVNNSQDPVKGLEFGRGGLGMRGEVPIFYDGLYVGILDIGMDVGEDFLGELKAKTNADWQLLITRRTVEATNFQPAAANYPVETLLLYASTLDAPFTAPEEAYTRVFNGEIVTSHIEGERHFVIHSFPLRDYSRRVIGVVDAISDRTAEVILQDRSRLTSSSMLLLAFVVGGFILTGLSNLVLRPLAALTETATMITDGDLSRTVEISKRHRDDELGVLSVAFNDMTEQLRSTLSGLEQRVADRTRALELSAQVSRSLSQILDPAELVAEVVKQLQKTFDYYHVHIYLFDEGRQNLELVGGTGEAGKIMMERGHKIPAGRGLVGRATETGIVVLVSDTSLDPNWLPNPLLPETKSEVAVPIMVGDQILGALDVQQNIVNGLTNQDADLLFSIANQVAVALRNARQYREAQLQAERTTRIDTVVRQIQGTQTIAEALQIAARELGRTLEMSFTQINLDPKKFSPTVKTSGAGDNGGQEDTEPLDDGEKARN